MNSDIRLSVVICSFNPIKTYLSQVLQSLSLQSLLLSQWELIIIDNNSDQPIKDWIDIHWHPNVTVANEKQSGLSYARLKGVSISKADLIVFVDDDNILDKQYLQKSLDFHLINPNVGCFGGKSVPDFEIPPPDWFFKTGIDLGCQDLGNQIYISNYASVAFEITAYPKFAPIGTGMVVKKTAFLAYVNEVENSMKRLALGRRGKSLTSGEDNDIILTIVKSGYELAYLPELIVTHLIPKNRLNFKYLTKMAYESNRSWIKVLHIHFINPWKAISPLTLKLREIKAYFINGAWKNKLNYIKWRAACGKFKGLSEL